MSRISCNKPARKTVDDNLERRLVIFPTRGVKRSYLSNILLIPIFRVTGLSHATMTLLVNTAYREGKLDLLPKPGPYEWVIAVYVTSR